MDFSAIGKKIKELRKLLGMSQGELAEGICTQAQISKIENGDVYPYASTLYLISQRLGVDVNYFFDIGMTPRFEYVQEVTEQLKQARRNSDYRTIKQIIDAEKTNPLFTQNNRNQQILLWYQGIYEHAANRNKKKAIELIQKAICLTKKTTKVWSEREIEMQLSIGAIFFEEHEYENTMKICLDARENLSLLPYINDQTLFSRISYNMARSLTRLGRYEESIKYCREAIRGCIQKDNLYLIGEFHYHIGYNYELLKRIKEAKSYMEKALIIFELQEDEKYIDFISSKIANWE